MPNQRKKCSGFLLLCFAFFLMLGISQLYSQEETSTETAREITGLEVIGLKRTKDHIARYPLERFIGRQADSLDTNEVTAVVKDTGILEPAGVELIETEEGVILRVTVQEKWTIIPFPLAMVSSGGNTFGLFLLDTNAFGLRDQAALGGMYGSTGWLAMALYNHTPNRRGQFGWNSSFMYSRREQEDQDRDEKIHRRYTTDQLRFSFGLYYPFTNHLTVFGAASFSKITLKDNNKTFNPPEDGAMLLGLIPGISLRYSDWDGFLLSQQSLSLEYQYNFAISGSPYQQTEMKAIFEKSIIPGFRLALKSGAVWTSGSDPKYEEGPHAAQVDILPRSFSAKHYAGLSAGLEKHLFKTKMGTLSVLSSWQCVFSHGPISGDEFDNGPSGGIRFYLTRIALPAMGITAAYNMNSGLLQFGFNLGMEF